MAKKDDKWADLPDGLVKGDDTAAEARSTEKRTKETLDREVSEDLGPASGSDAGRK